ncbi:Tetraacyldisaccharide 4'-kinase [Rhodovastum atsumiense]|uniref:Tetraacyldisaccharide 4'-kinase n=1 Tax=Rhodovastum atsumiense TaxID=504468 RepID=A0A5M6IZP7_9PROT|nr:tetraacyldisaccharide 4'-kinase [Rhodovastum atsumiense]KAA5613307.1 tetraacyldisaccharide 4'-kinase [Rhodovastum atsumiense]CAH2600518.1 Tetraacyldisaccharide 4'-kinase [Rhodovastum atsumiense]
MTRLFATSPGFWRHGQGGWPARLLAPAACVYAAATAQRVARPGWRAPVPVICCGNATAGGAGKTTLALDLGERLAGRGVAFLTRGHGGRVRDVHRVDPGRDAAAIVGDEPLLLAGCAPTFVAADRAAAARAAIAAGAGVLVLDDGLQNPTLAKDLSLLVIDGASGFGNGHVIPAGPLREPVAAAAARCAAAVLIGEDRTGAAALLPPALPVLRARLQQTGADDLAGRRVLAFAGIGIPGKFFAGLAAAGATLADAIPFPDHHPYTETEIRVLLARAVLLRALPVTTPKDAIRLPPELRAQLRQVGVRLVWDDPAALDARLASMFLSLP